MTAPESPAAPRRRRHLMDPANPQRTAQSAGRSPGRSTGRSTGRSGGKPMSIGSVQRWVMSALAVTTIGHFAAGLVVAAIFLEDGRPGARVGLTLIAGVVGVLGVAAAFAIHQKSPVTPWLVVGLLPTAVGLFFVL